MNKSLLIIGSGGHGRVCAEIATLMKSWSKIYFLDDNHQGLINGIEILGKVESSVFSPNQYDVFVAIGDNHIRSKILKDFQLKGFKMATLKHPSAVVSETSRIGEGTVIMPKAVINSNVTISDGVIINTGTIIEHDCKIYDFVHVSPNATLLGNVTIGNHTWVGASATIKNNLTVTSDVIIGMGSVVLKNIDSDGVYIGVPVQKMRNKK